jgi:hypothetical protein
MISSNPYNPLRPTAGITHTWMGESWMVDGETSVMMMAMISSNTPSRRGARIEFLVPNRGFWWWRRNGTLSRKKAEPPDVFRSEALCRWKGVSRRWLRWPHHPLARPGLARATRWCGPLVAPLHLLFWLCESSGEIGTLRYFLGFIMKVGFLHKKRHQSTSAENSVSSC